LNFLDNNGLLMQGVEHCRFNDDLLAIMVRATLRKPVFCSPELWRRPGRRSQNGRMSTAVTVSDRKAAKR
jgi:hypothetical protein